MKKIILKNKKYLASLFWRILKWHVLYYFAKKPYPLSSGLYITNRCNLKCGFCNIWRKHKKETLSLENTKKIIDALSDIECYYFSVTGGEPLLVDYIFDVLEYARKSNIKYIHMVTNGYLLDENTAKQLSASGLDELSISLDGDEAFHDNQRGMKGAYERAVTAINNMHTFAPNVSIVLNSVLSPQHLSQCLHVLKLAHQYGIFIKVQPLNRHPQFNDKDSAPIPDRNNLSGINNDLKAAINTLIKDKRVINSTVFLENIYNFYFDADNLILRDQDCIFGYHHIEILENAEVFPCLEGMHWENGMLLNGSFKKMLRSKEYLDMLKSLRKCALCRQNYYICYYEPRIAFPITHCLRFR